MASTSSNPNAGLPPKPVVISGRANRREKRRARRSAGQGTPDASGSSTPLQQQDGGESKRVNGQKPLGNGSAQSSSAPNGKLEVKTKTTSFEEGEEFIPFVFSDHSDDEAGPSTLKKDVKGKGKEKEVEVEVGDVNASDTTSKPADQDSKPADAPLSERAKEKSTARDSERDWDRGKPPADDVSDDEQRRRNGSHKRKYKDFDPDDGYANKKQRMDAASRKCPWVDGLDLERCSNVAELLHKEVDAFVEWISPTPVEDEIRGLIVNHITKVVSSAFPDASVYPFGSFQTKLYLPLGDIDLVILSDQMAYSDKTTVLHVLANVLKRAGITSHVTIIGRAKVPIVKFTTTHGRFKVDISINHANGLVSGKIISGFLRDLIPSAAALGRESKALRALVMITKAFLSQRSMNEVYTGGLGSYAIVCLAVSFLQMHPKIRRGEIDPEENLGVLAMEFFELYGHHFNYDEVGISLREGGMYFSKRQRGWHVEYKKSMLSIEDPADPSNDISSGSYNFHKVRTAFAGCHGILTSTAYLRAGILSSRRHGRSVNLRGHYEPEDLSILATVMGVTQETINHRRLVQELYDRRTLHNILGVHPTAVSVSFHGDSAHDRRDHRDHREQNDGASSSRSNASRSVLESVYEHRGNRHHDRHDRDRDYYDRDREYEYDYEEEEEYYHRSGDRGRDRDGNRDRDHDRSRRHRERWEEEDLEGGRYDIGRQPPKKRRRTGRAEEDARTVYVVDDDEEDEEERRRDEEEDAAYASDTSVVEVEGKSKRDGDSGKSRSGDGNGGGDSRRDGRRSYWLSKAPPAMADPMDDSS